MAPRKHLGLAPIMATGLLLAGPRGGEADAMGRRLARVHSTMLVDPLPVNKSVSEVLSGKIATVLDIGEISSAGGGDAKGGQYPRRNSTIAAQVAEEDIKSLKKRLSPACSDRFNEQMEGKGPKMHSFRSTGGAKDAPQCEKLKGHLCQTEAKMHQDNTNSSGRKMVKSLKVEGNSCVPAECTGQKDLVALAEFKLKVVKTLINNHDTDVTLHIDCTGAGGAVASCGGLDEAKPLPKSRAAATALAATAFVILANALCLV